MEMYERIKDLRKKYLKLSQEAFGGRLGVSRSVINNIERNALARPDQKLSLIKLICKEFTVNEDWLLNGNEPMFVEPDTFSLDEFMKQRGATELEKQIVKTYFDLDPDTREMLVDHFRKGLTDSAPVAAEKEQAGAVPETGTSVPKAGDVVPKTGGSVPERTVEEPGNKAPAAGRTMQEVTREELHAELDRQLDAEKEAEGNAPGYGRGSSGKAAG